MTVTGSPLSKAACSAATFDGRVSLTGEGVHMLTGGRERWLVFVDRNRKPGRNFPVDVVPSRIDVDGPAGDENRTRHGTHCRQQRTHIGSAVRQQIDEQLRSGADQMSDLPHGAPLNRMKAYTRDGQFWRHRRRVAPGHVDRPSGCCQSQSGGSTDGSGSAHNNCPHVLPP